MAADRVTTGGSRTRTLPPRPLAPPTGPAHRPAKASTGSMVNIAKVGTKVTGRSQEKHRDPDHDIFYSSDSELGGGHHKQVGGNCLYILQYPGDIPMFAAPGGREGEEVQLQGAHQAQRGAEGVLRADRQRVDQSRQQQHGQVRILRCDWLMVSILSSDWPGPAASAWRRRWTSWSWAGR